MKTTMHLLDTVDRNLLQNLQNAFAKLIGTTVAAVDPYGNPITAPSAYAASDDPAPSAMAKGRPDVAPAAVMVYNADAWLGQWLIGEARALTASPDVRSLVFIPMEVDGTRIGFLGFDRQTVRDWQPETLTRFWDLGKALAENLGGKNTTGEDGGAPSRFGPVYGKTAPRHSVTA